MIKTNQIKREGGLEKKTLKGGKKWELKTQEER